MKKEKGQLEIKNSPNFREELRFWKMGCKFVVGLDEVGRGPLAGPVVAAAVCIVVSLRASRNCGTRGNPAASGMRTGLLLPPRRDRNDAVLRDSKRLSPKQREKWYEILTNHPNIKWGIGMVSEKIIDQINILEATKLAMRRALENLEIEPEYLLLDGNFSIRIARTRPLASRNANACLPVGKAPMRMIPCKSIIKGDEKIISCTAASIIAKVTRDRLMIRYHKKYPRYGFDRHKGYGTKAHLAAIKKHGPCKIHRLTFSPFRQKL